MDRLKAIEVLKPLVESYVDYANIGMKKEDDDIANALEMAVEALKTLDVSDTNVGDMISRQAALDAITDELMPSTPLSAVIRAKNRLKDLPSAQPEIIRCKDCKHWRQQTNYQGAPWSFGFCESDAMWCSLYGETAEVSRIGTDDDFYCGYAERKNDG